MPHSENELSAIISDVSNRLETIANQSSYRMEDVHEWSRLQARRARLQRRRARLGGEEAATRIRLRIPWSSGASLPQVVSFGLEAYVVYYVREKRQQWPVAPKDFHLVNPLDTPSGPMGLAKFKPMRAIQFYMCGEEMRRRHRLFDRGLNTQGAYLVVNSRWLKRLIEEDSASPGHIPAHWVGAKHYLLLFHENIIEYISENFEVGFLTNPINDLLKRLTAPNG